MGDIDSGTQDLGLRSDCLAHGRASVEDELQVEVGDDRAGRAHMIGRTQSLLVAPCPETLIQHLEPAEDAFALAVERRHWRDGKYGVALELRDLELRLDPLGDGTEQFAENGITRRDASAEVDAVVALDIRQEGGVTGDVGQHQVPIAGHPGCLRRIDHGQCPSYDAYRRVLVPSLPSSSSSWSNDSSFQLVAPVAIASSSASLDG